MQSDPRERRLDETLADGDRNRFGSGVRVELGEDVGDVRLNCAGADAEQVCDFAIGLTGDDVAQDLEFPGRQPMRRPGG